VIVSGNASMAPMMQATSSLPIVFVNVADPVGAGFVASLAHPGGNVTGFMQFEYSLSSKWVDLLKQIAPGVKRVAEIRDPAITAGVAQFAVVQATASAAALEVTPVNVRDVADIERTIASFAQVPNGGVIVTASAQASSHRDNIIATVAKYRLPTVYFRINFVKSGGLISYGIDLADQNRRAAGYVDRILKGEKPADLPVQAPTKYQLCINRKTATAIGLEIPSPLLSIADEVIECGGGDSWPGSSRRRRGRCSRMPNPPARRDGSAFSWDTATTPSRSNALRRSGARSRPPAGLTARMRGSTTALRCLIPR
jgi:putative ABC transport system substrate-binding protein